MKNTLFAVAARVCIVGIGLATTGLVACGGGDNAPSYTDSSVFCTTLATAECEAAKSPCSFSDLTKCVSARTNLCKTSASAIEGRGRKFLSSGAASAIGVAKNMYSKKGVALTSTQFSDYAKAFNGAFEATAGLGQACASDYDCKDGNICSFAQVGRTHVCGKKQEKKIGDGCGNNGEVCEKTAYCGSQSQVVGNDGLSCQSRLKAGDVCNSRGDQEHGYPACEDSLYCGKDLKCVTSKGTGSDCTSDVECNVTNNLYCVEGANKSCTFYSLENSSAACTSFENGKR